MIRKFRKKNKTKQKRKTLADIYSPVAYYSEMVSTRVIRPDSDRCGSVYIRQEK